MNRLAAPVIVLIAFVASEGFGMSMRQRRDAEPKYFDGVCDEPNGRYAVASQCDAYVQCTDFIPKEKLCSDGLLFDDQASLSTFPCKYPIEVDCRARAVLQEAQPTENCPHQFGYYKLGPPAHCGRYKLCVNGVAEYMRCTKGLAFDKRTNQCIWPDEVPDCDVEAFLGFRCPPQPETDDQLYESKNCDQYFSCLNGRPRLNVCRKGFVFNLQRNSCVDSENIIGCQQFV